MTTLVWPTLCLLTTYRCVLLVQLLLLREEVQTLPERHPAGGAPLGHGEGQVTEDVERVGVVGTHGAVEGAAQLAREQV